MVRKEADLSAVACAGEAEVAFRSVFCFLACAEEEEAVRLFRVPARARVPSYQRRGQIHGHGRDLVRCYDHDHDHECFPFHLAEKRKGRKQKVCCQYVCSRLARLAPHARARYHGAWANQNALEETRAR